MGHVFVTTLDGKGIFVSLVYKLVSFQVLTACSGPFSYPSSSPARMIVQVGNEFWKVGGKNETAAKVVPSRKRRKQKWRSERREDRGETFNSRAKRKGKRRERKGEEKVTNFLI